MRPSRRTRTSTRTSTGTGSWARYWLDHRSLDIGTDPIAYTDGVRDWFPTAWLSEVTYAAIVGAFGYQGLIALRFVLALAFYALLGRFLHRHYPLGGGDHVVHRRAARRRW